MLCGEACVSVQDATTWCTSSRPAPATPSLHVLHPATSFLYGTLQSGVDTGHDREVACEDEWSTNQAWRLWRRRHARWPRRRLHAAEGGHHAADERTLRSAASCDGRHFHLRRLTLHPLLNQSFLLFNKGGHCAGELVGSRLVEVEVEAEAAGLAKGPTCCQCADASSALVGHTDLRRAKAR